MSSKVLFIYLFLLVIDVIFLGLSTSLLDKYFCKGVINYTAIQVHP